MSSGQTFDLVDEDGSGFLEREEVEQWMRMVGSELDTSKITDLLLKDGNLAREDNLKTIKLTPF